MSCISDLDCSGHGICNNVCECYLNYSGNRCESCATDDYQRGFNGCCLKKCIISCDSARYICQQDPTLKTNLCSCKITNADPDKECAYCINGFSATIEGTCEPSGCVKNRQLCSHQGACINIDGFYICDCSQGFTGTFCENCLNGKVMTIDGKCLPEQCVDKKSKECSGFGNCNIESLECICDHGYAGRTCQNCNIGFREYSDRQAKIFKSKNGWSRKQKQLELRILQIFNAYRVLHYKDDQRILGRVILKIIIIL